MIFVFGVGFLAQTGLAQEGHREELFVVYFSRILEGEVAAIDVQSDAIIHLLRTGSNPAEIGIVTALSRAFVADLTDGTVTVIDTTNHSIDDVIAMASPVATMRVDEAAQRVYALDFSNGVPGTDLHVIDAATNLEIDTFTVGSRTQNICRLFNRKPGLCDGFS